MGITSRLRFLVGVPLLVFSAAALADNAMTTESADLYAGPDDSYPVVAQLDSNSPVQVMGCLDDWSWCDVLAGDARGWMYAPDITYAYEGGYVPLYTYAPSLGIAVVPFSLDVYWGHYYHGRPWYSQREEWGRRTVHHRRPAGPPPSAGPPPRPEHREGPREAARPDNRPLHLGEAQAPRPDERSDRHGAAQPPRPDEHADRYGDAERRADADRRAETQRHDNMSKHPEPPRSAEPPRPAEPPRHAEAPRPETHAAPAPAPAHAPPHEPSHEEHGRAAPPAHEEHPHDDHPHQ